MGSNNADQITTEVRKLMNRWFAKNLGDAMLVSEELDHIELLFQSEYEKANSPKEMAVFYRHESEGHLHCEVIAYFSPASIAVATAAGAIPCIKPSPHSLGLLFGSEDSWSALFPESGR